MPSRRTVPAYAPGDIKNHAGSPTRLPYGWALADWRIALKSEFPRLAAAIGQAWRDAGDTYDTATHFRFPDGARFIKGGTWTSSGGATVYPLADDGTVAAAQGFGHLPMTAPGYQSFAYVQTAAASPVGLLGLPANLVTAAVPVPASGAIAAQMEVTGFDVPALGEYHGAGSLVLIVLSGAGAVVGNAAAGFYQSQDGGRYVNLSVNGATPVPDAAIASAILGKSTGLYVNADGTIGWTAAGVDYGAVPGLVVPVGGKVAFGIIVNDGPAFTLGLSASGSLLAASADLTEPFPAGTIGAGNALSPLVVASSVGTRAGAASTGGHVLSATEMPGHSHKIAVTTASVGTGLGAAAAQTLTIGGADYNLEGLPLQAATHGDSSSVGGGAAHSHTIDPEHATMLVLVKL